MLLLNVVAYKTSPADNLSNLSRHDVSNCNVYGHAQVRR